jgi:hypothetical protein
VLSVVSNKNGQSKSAGNLNDQSLGWVILRDQMSNRVYNVE